MTPSIKQVRWWEGGKVRQEQYLIDQRIIQNITKQWEEKVLARRYCTVQIPHAQLVHRTV